MPILDMPLHELKTFPGRNPCPADLDAFWDASVAEMEALGTGYELVKADFQAPGAICYHLYFTGVDGARVHAKFLRPEKIDRPCPAVCCFHGYPGASPEFSWLLSYVQAGFVVAALDCRGQKGLSQDVGGVMGNTQHGHIIRGLAENDPRKLLYRAIYLDTAQIARIVMAMDIVDETRVGAFGGSQGGGLTLACASLVPEVNRIVPVYPFLSDYLRVWEMDLAANAYAELKDYFRRFDPRHERHDEIFTRLGYIDVHNLASRIKAKTLMFTGMMDTTCPPSTQFAAYNAITAEKDYILYPDYAHEGLPGAGDITFKFMAEML
jgi:cephalosporin-C deacetylase